MFWKQSIRLYTENILDSKQWLKKTQIIVSILVIKRQAKQLISIVIGKHFGSHVNVLDLAAENTKCHDQKVLHKVISDITHC